VPFSTTIGVPLGHETLFLRQTDAAATHGQSVACSGAGLTADTGNANALAAGGTPGVTPVTVTVGASATEAAFFLESAAVGLVTWNAGVWTVYVNIQTGNANVTADSIYICRVNSAGVSQGTVASRTGLSRSLTAAEVKAIYLFQENDVTAAATDRIYIVFVLTNADGGAQSVVVLPDQLIVTPIKTVIHVGARSQRVRALHKHLTGVVRLVATPPSVVVDVAVAAPCAIVRIYAPPNLSVTGPLDIPLE
jgi:hypothetical protein